MDTTTPTDRLPIGAAAPDKPDIMKLAREWANARMAYGRATAETIDVALNRLLDAEQALFNAIWNGGGK